MASSEPANLVTVFTANYGTEIEIARSILESGGMEAFVFDRHLNGLYSGNAFPMRLVVHAEDAADALAALRQFGFLK